MPKRIIKNFKMTEMSACKQGMNSAAKIKIIKSDDSEDINNTVVTTKEENSAMDDFKKELDELKKEMRPISIKASMTAIQKEIFDGMEQADQDDLLAKTDEEIAEAFKAMESEMDKKKKKKKDQMMGKSDNPFLTKGDENDSDVAYTTIDGIQIMKSEGELAVQLAKEVDVLKAARHSTTVDNLVKENMSNMSGSDEDKREIVSAILKAHPSPEDHEPLLKVLKKQDEELERTAGRQSVSKERTEKNSDTLSYHDAMLEITEKANEIIEKGVKTTDFMTAFDLVYKEDLKRYASIGK